MLKDEASSVFEAGRRLADAVSDDSATARLTESYAEVGLLVGDLDQWS